MSLFLGAALIFAATIAVVASHVGQGKATRRLPKDPQAGTPTTPQSPARLTPDQLLMLSYATRRGGVEIVYRGIVRYQVGDASGSGEARVVHALARKGLLKETQKNLYIVTRAGRLASLEPRTRN